MAGLKSPISRIKRGVAAGALALGVSAALAACAGYGVHKIDIQQGNLITEEQLAKVKEGMSRADVKTALGTPLLADVFHSNRWDFYYSDDRGTRFGPFGRERQKFHVTIRFADDKVSKIEGVASPVEIMTGGGDRRRSPDATPPGAPPPKS
jgi:outer membrane protein assembly factor BamE